MGKRAQEKRLRKDQDYGEKRSRFNWRAIKHLHLVIAVLAFVLVIGYPLITNSVWYKKHITRISGEELAVETAQKALITTDKGQITVQFEKTSAPKTVENFVRLSSRDYYNGLTFHRVEPGFVIQGGDPKGDGTGGESAWGGTFNDEIDASLPVYQKGYVEGTVAMANAGPNTNGSQFFIVLADQPNLPASYTIFGHVTEGMDVVKKIVKGDKMTKVEVQ